MAHGRPWYKRAGGDFVMATLGMPDADHKWAYSAIIDMLNDRDRPLSDEPGFICGFTGLSKRKWTAVRSYLIDQGHLIILPDGTLTNPRFERERAERLAEHDRAVETGRLGGKKSAAKRAGQAELDLGDDANSGLSPEKQAEESEINGAKSESNPPLIGEERPKSANDDQGPPQPSRARKRLEARVEGDSTTHLSGTDPGATGGEDREGRLGNADLKALFDACCDAAGYRPSSPSQINNGMALVEDWKKRGFNFDDVVLPAIRHVIHNSADRTRSLHRFRDHVEHEQARAKAGKKLSGRAPRKTDAPVLEPDGEAEAVRPLRAQLLESLGPERYAVLLNPVRFEPIGHGAERPLRVTGAPYAVEPVVHGDHAATVRRVALAHGFSDVWK